MRAITPTVVGQHRSGFTLVELVVVILVLGIIAAVAVPKVFDVAADSRENSTKASLKIIRDAIELYKFDNGIYPGEDTPAEPDPTEIMAPYIKGPFPVSQLSVSPQDASIKAETDGGALADDVDDSTDWLYDITTGEFIINHSSYYTW